MGQSRSGLVAAGFIASAAAIVYVLFVMQRSTNPVSGDQQAVVTDMMDLTEEGPTDATIAPPQPDAPDNFPAVTTDAVRTDEDRSTPQPLTFTIVEQLDHDTNAFTQGFEISNGSLFESTGLVGRSSIRELDLASGAVVRSTPVDDVFAEGLTIVDDTALQITWRDGVAYRRDLDTFDVIETYTYDGEGWGICHDGSQLVMSDGTSTLDFRDPTTFEVEASVEVTFGGEPVELINELECVGGTVWANIWMSSLIVEIDPVTGNVIGVLNANALTPVGVTGSDAVLNGIAYDDTDGTFLLTGKLWPTIYRVRIEPSAQ